MSERTTPLTPSLNEPAGPKWTTAQRQAIEDEGGALLVSAAAGSGKTAVLVERAVRLITREADPVQADRLLILTFTNAAAEELRARIAARLQEEAIRQPHSAALRRQRLYLRRAFIGTIDAFCQQLVREHFAQLAVPPDVAVADEALTAQLQAAVLADVMEEMYQSEADGEAFATFAALYGRARSDDKTERTVLALAAFTKTLPDPAARLESYVEMYADERPLWQTEWGRLLAQDAQNALDEAENALREAIGEAEAADGFAAYLPALQAWLGLATGMRAALAAGRWDEAVALLRQRALPRFGSVRNADEEIKQRITAGRDAAKAVMEDLEAHCLACTGAEYAEDRVAALPMVAALCRAAGLFEQRFYEAKLAQRVLDFADFEHLALRLLRDGDGRRTPLAEQVSARYDAVMVDEYQDTNELQSALYECLARADGSNLFYVGDIKQSIYRFRQASPELFLEKKQRWEPYGSGHPAVLTLGHNFRSAPGVIDGVNYLFGQLMSRELGDVDYGEGERLIAGAAAELPGGVELCAVEDDGAPAAEARWVAGRIAQMVREGYSIQDGKTTRCARYDDFAVLLRSRGRQQEFVAALEEARVPVSADLSGELLLAPEVLPLCAALCAIDNPGDDIQLAAAMLGPLFRFTPDEMVRLRTGVKKGRLWGAVAASQDEKVRRFADTLRYYRALSGQMNVGRLCEELVGGTGYLSAVAAMESGAARRDNLQRFIGWAAEVSAGGRGGLSAFVRLLQSGTGPAAPAAKGVPGCVSLLTIHKSKGLEFPVCFLADTARLFNRTDLNDRVQMHARLGIGLHLRSGDALYPTLPALAIRAEAADEMMSEEMRVLYVAATRAKQRLVASLACQDVPALLEKMVRRYGGSVPGAYTLKNARCMADWLCAAALSAPRDGAAGRLTLEVVAPPPAGGEATQAQRAEAQPDEALAAKLAAGFALTPPRRALAGVPAKMSVSALAKGEGETLRRRPSFMFREGLSAAERGTAQHSFMQYANMAAAEADLEGEITRLRREGFITEVAADAVDRSGVRTFLASALWRRAGAARQLREYDFIVAVPAGLVRPELSEALAGEEVLVQGIADLILLTDDGAEIVDYKTDHGIDEAGLVARYAPQLRLYRQAIEKRLATPVTRLTVWSFALAREVDIPLDDEG